MSGPETPLAGRYRFVRRIQAGQKTIAWLVSDQRSDRQLVAAALGASRLKALKPALGVRHKYLASIVEIVEDPDPAEIPGDGALVRAAAVALAEIVSGLTLHDQLKGGSLGVSDSVAVLAGVCDASQALHDVNAAHGAISPRSILIAPSEPRPTPVLLQLVAPTSGAYSTPERLLGQGPTAEDDVWALHASLYASLTGSAPFDGTSKDALVTAMKSNQRQPLSAFGIDEPSLQTLIDRGLDGDSSRRTQSVRELKQGLYDWLRARVPQRDSLSEIAPPSLDWDDPAPVIESAPPIALYSDEEDGALAKPKSAEQQEKSPEPPEPMAASPPATPVVLPEATAEPVEKPTVVFAAAALRADRPTPGKRPRAPRFPAPKERHTRSGKFIFVALGLGALAFGAAFYAGRKLKPDGLVGGRRPSAALADGRDAPPLTKPSATVSSLLAAPPLASADAAAPPDLRDPRVRRSCVASYFPEDTFQGDEDFGFLCNKEDFRSITSRLHRQVVVSSKGMVTAGMKQWATLDWYEIAVTAVLRGGCCPADVPAIELPAYAYTGICEPIAESLVKVGRHPISPDETRERAKAFAAEIRCLYVNDVPRPFRYPAQPTGANRLVFEAFLERAAKRNGN